MYHLLQQVFHLSLHFILPGDQLYGLWTVEEIRELPDEEIAENHYQKNGEAAPGKPRGGGDAFFNQGRNFKHQDGEDDGEDEDEGASIDDNALKETEDEDEDEDSSMEEEDKKLAPHKHHRGGDADQQQNIVEKAAPNFGGDIAALGRQQEANHVRRDRRGEEGPIEGLRHAMGHNDDSMRVFLEKVEKNGGWR